MICFSCCKTCAIVIGLIKTITYLLTPDICGIGLQLQNLHVYKTC